MQTPVPTAEPPGWYGKLPTLGDFASRRLPVDFIEAWDDWLAHGIAAWRGSDPEGWLDGYLQGPSWRFVLLPGALAGPAGEHAWTGVLMPSVDRVGRYFPLTLAQPLAPLPADPATTENLLRWLQRLDDTAVDSLHDDWTIEQLESALAAIGGWPQPPGKPADGPGAGIDLQAHPHGSSLWLGMDADGRTRLRVEPGLPQGAAFSALLSGTGTDSPFSTPSTNLLREFP